MSNLFVPIKKADLKWCGTLPISPQYDDRCYFSEDGMEQSRDVFINGNNLIQRWQSLSTSIPSIFTIAETRFGAGLNFLVSWYFWEQHAPPSCQLHFISCEKHPFSLKDLKKILPFWKKLNVQAEQLIEHYPILTPGYHHLSFDEGRIHLTLMLGDALECYEQLLICGEPQLESELRISFVDAWYFDDFMSVKNKNACSDSLIKVISILSREQTTFATYPARDLVKKNLNQYGFYVEKRKKIGPKRYMLYGHFTHLPEKIATKRYTPWHVGKPKKTLNKSAVIIGAGLAGCFTAFSLAKKGWRVTIIDELNEVGKGGSANQQAVLFPKLSAYSAPLTQFMLMSFLYSVRVYQFILNQTKLGELNGALLLAYDAKEQAAQMSLCNWLFHYPELGRLVNRKQASELAGCSLPHSGLFIPLSGWINSPVLCQFLVNKYGISVLTNTPVTQLTFDKHWIINELETEILILANGHKVNSFEETSYLPVKPIRGQMTAVLSTSQSAQLKIPLCAEGHVLPAFNGIHQMGATYESNSSIAKIKDEDDQINLAKLKQLTDHVLWSDTVTDHWSGIRASTPDYLPLVGKIANAEKFLEQYKRLEANARQWIPQAAPYYPGLYACAGFGSRGLTSIPLCAEWLASLVNNEQNFLPRNLQQALSPVRFLRKNIIRGKA